MILSEAAKGVVSGKGTYNIGLMVWMKYSSIQKALLI